ncbi:MAG: NB-ARC domain-containing protein, partial [Thermomicrobiales bacterium]
MTSVAQPPRFLTSFLGRDRERGELRALFADPAVRLVSLVGPGGVGKTRLAAEVSPEIAADLGLRIGYVALSALGSEESVLQAVGRALNVADQPDLGLPRAIRGALERNPTLIVLDNFEHLLDQALAVGELLAVPSTRVIVTSRAPLEIRGEQVFPILPFGVPSTTAQMTTSELRKLDSVLLFEERARAVQHDFRLNDANAAAVAGICIRLDGLPLALELAAARSRMLAPGVLLARLDRPLEALGSGPLDSPDRHRSLRAALAWSYDLLSPSEQVLFRRLAVPRGTFAIAAVEALADDLSVDPLDAISSLVSKSLVQPSNILRGDGVEWVRFQLLDTVREFALEKLAASDDFVASHNRFAAHIVEVALQVPAEYPMTAAGGDMAFDITGVDRAPALAALDWLHRSGQHGELVRAVAALAPHWFARGALRDAHACLEIALALTAESESADYARATVAMGMVAIQQGKFEYGEAHLLAGLDLARKSGAEEWVGQASFSMGVVEQDRGRPEAALPFFESARASFLA